LVRTVDGLNVDLAEAVQGENTRNKTTNIRSNALNSCGP
jgi:hypothetical protein